MRPRRRARPANLAAYDDAAVASDRLGRPDEAIAFLDEKKAQLDALPDSDARKISMAKERALAASFRTKK